MKTLSVLAVAACLAVSPALASPVASGDPTSAVQSATAADANDPVKLDLAREFVSLMYPVSDTIEYTRRMWLMPLDVDDSNSLPSTMKQQLVKAFDKVEPMIVRHYPTIQEAYAGAFAREYTVSELRDLLAFARTPTGRHFLKDTTIADSDEQVMAAGEALSAEMEPIMLELAKMMCEQATQVRVTHGETGAKCAMS